MKKSTSQEGLVDKGKPPLAPKDGGTTNRDKEKEKGRAGGRGRKTSSIPVAFNFGTGVGGSRPMSTNLTVD